MDVKVLSDALGIAKRFMVKRTSPLPVLQYVHIEADSQNVVRIRATDLETQVEIKAPITSNDPIKVCVSAKQLTEFLKGKKGEIKFQEESNGQFVLSSGSFSMKLWGMSPDEFPSSAGRWDIVFSPVAFRYTTGAVVEAFERTWRIAYDLDERPVLQCIWLGVHEGKLSSASADGFHLAKWKGGKINVLIGKKVVKNVLPLLLKKANPEGITVITRYTNNSQGSRSRISFDLGVLNIDVFHITNTKIEHVPNYKQVFPRRKPRRSFVIERTPFLDIIKQISSMKDSEGEEPLALYMQINPRYLHIWSGADGLYTAAINCKATLKDDQPITTCVSPRFLMNILESMQRETCKVQVDKTAIPICKNDKHHLHGYDSTFSEPSPLVIDDGPGASYLLMPKVVSDEMLFVGLDSEKVAQEKAYFEQEYTEDCRERMEKNQ
jgi:DNA polymerase III sliding clamp (beta) subunit (PCNA family)